MTRTIARLALTIMIVGAGFATQSVAQPDNAAGALAAVDHACRDILGTAPGEEHFGSCVASLSASMRQSGVNATRVSTSADASGRSYFTGSPSSVHQREGRACASVGFNPVGQAYECCVADLSANMFAIDHPLN